MRLLVVCIHLDARCRRTRGKTLPTTSEILDSPSSKPTLKAEVRRRLDDIASQTYAHIAVVNSPLSLSTRTLPDGITSSAGWTGLESERVCELVITGHGDSVDLARVRLLVMLDELVSNNPAQLPRYVMCASNVRIERSACRVVRD